LEIIIFSLAIILIAVCIKYKPVYEVKIAGEILGFTAEKETIERNLDKYINDNSKNIAFREIEEMPEYELKLVGRSKETKESEVLASVKDTITTTYKRYAVTLDGEEKLFLESQNTAEKVIEEIKENLNEDVVINLGVVEDYTTEYEVSNEEEAKDILNEIKVAKVEEVEHAKQIESMAAKRLATTGNIRGISISIPVVGPVSSRFGSRSAARTTIHTGVDIRAKQGTPIKPIAAGTVTVSQYNGGYGNLIIINHGNGIESYYAHCDEIYISTGEYVDIDRTIGAVGSTGNSTGYHLHLEIRIDGTAINPQEYLY